MPRIPLGRLLHMSTIFMTLALAMNVHALASRMGEDDRSTQPENTDTANLTAKLQAPLPKPHHEQPSVSAASANTEGWKTIPVTSEGIRADDDAIPVDAAFLKNDGPAASCIGISCVPGGATDVTDTPTTDQAQAELVKRLLSHQGSIEDERRKLEEQKHVLDSARIVLEEKMRAIDNSMAELAEKQAQHKEMMVAETSRLVKIYEEMPPREAAAVFNIMDIHVLVSIANSMNPRKISAIMGYMFPERVNTVSQYLAGVRNFHLNRSGPDSVAGHAGSVGTLSWLPSVGSDYPAVPKE